MLALDLEEEASPEKHGADEAVAQEVAAEPDTAAQREEDEKQREGDRHPHRHEQDGRNGR